MFFCYYSSMAFFTDTIDFLLLESFSNLFDYNLDDYLNWPDYYLYWFDDYLAFFMLFQIPWNFSKSILSCEFDSELSISDEFSII